MAKRKKKLKIFNRNMKAKFKGIVVILGAILSLFLGLNIKGIEKLVTKNKIEIIDIQKSFEDVKKIIDNVTKEKDVEVVNKKSEKFFEENESEEDQFRVLYISDGDTISIKKEKKGILEGEIIKVRLFGIDAPEKKQDYGLESKEVLSRKIKGKLIEIEEKSKDRYGRMVAIVKLNGRNINEEMIRDGYAWYYSIYDKNNERSKKYQENAMKNKLGLFSRRGYVEPWIYRKNSGKNKK